MTEDELVRPVDDGISPYLRRSLRTLEKAERDHKDRQRKITADGVKGFVT
jgi:hypothetical protein